MDLPCAFDSMARSKLWEVLKAKGLDHGQVSFLRALLADLNATVRYGPNGECSEKFGLGRDVSQSCVLAPILFLLYINDLDFNLVTKGKEMPVVGGRIISVLLYANEAVLMTITPNGLQYF